MRTKLNYTEDKKWEYLHPSRAKNNTVSTFLIEYLNLLSPIFEAAKEKCEFEFIFTLLRVKGLEAPGWDAYDTTEDIVNKMRKIIDNTHSIRTNRYLSLWLYGHIIEASEPYHILANLLRVAAGNRYLVDNFPNKKRGNSLKPISPGEKIKLIKNLSRKASLESNISPLTDIYNRELRNAIFHSDFTLYDNDFRIQSIKKVFPLMDYSSIVNKSFAYFTAFSTLVQAFIGDYDEPTTIKPHPDFATTPDELFITIVRKGTGVIGLTDVWLQSHIDMNKTVHLIGRFTKEESELHKNDPTILKFPKSKRDLINRRLEYVPWFLRSTIVKYYSRRI